MKRLSIFLVLAVVLIAPCLAQAQEEAPLTTDELLVEIVGQTIVDEAAERSEDVRTARDVLRKARRAGTRQEQQEAEEDLNEAEEQYAKAQKHLDQARIDAFADRCGKSSAEIQAMRDSGKGWGVIAQECGIHPSAAGKGKNKAKDKNKDKARGKGKVKGVDLDEDEDLDQDQDQSRNKGKKDKKGKGKKK
ncbi:MAG: hypothetical protein H0S80_05015 [Desulfovibrionaceae bacterium]|nr:hypothetical protein [Desulfovibrionaceae bacterium]